VNARFTTFQETDHKEMVRKAPKTRAKPQRTRRDTKKEDFTAKGAKAAKKEEQRPATAPGDHRNRASSPISEGSALPQRAQRNTEEEASEVFTAEVAEIAKERKALQQRTQRNTEGDQNQVDPQDSLDKLPEGSGRSFTAEDAVIAKEVGPEAGTALRVEDRLEPQNAEVNPGVESAKSIFFGVESGEGVADNRPLSPLPEPSRKSSQSEVLLIPKDVEHHLRR
jgi:hypothetical protein